MRLPRWSRAFRSTVDLSRRGSAGLVKVTLALIAAGVGTASIARVTSSSIPAAPFYFVGDTTFHFGPVQRNGSGGNGTTYIEQITISVVPGQLYKLRIVNGNTNGTNRVNSAVSKWNGKEVVSSSNITSSTPSYVTELAATPTDTLRMTLVGPSGSFVNVSVFSVPDPTYNIFGDSVLNIPTGTSKAYSLTLTVPTGAAPPYRMYVVNGNASGGQRVTGQWIKINGNTITANNDLSTAVGSFTKVLTELSASNALNLNLNGPTGSFIRMRITATDTVTPLLTVTAPADSITTNQTSIAANGTITDQSATTVSVNGTAATVTNNTTWVATVPLPTEGWQSLTYVATDAGGKSRTVIRQIRRDTQAPVLTLSAPADNSATKNATVAVTGTVTDATAVTVNTNGTPLSVVGTAVSGTVALAYGVNPLVTTATDAAGNSTGVTRTVTRDTLPPSLTVTAPTDNSTVTTDSVTVSGTVSDATAVTVSASGVSLPVVSGAFTGKVALEEGPNTIAIVATDAATNTTTVNRTVTRGVVIPPDPATIAPAIDQTIPSTPGRANAFLYTGADPIQTGVVPGTIDERRSAVLRGKVLDGAGSAISGVKVSIHAHPEYGQTYSRLDGMFDLAMNGGEPLTLKFEKSGFPSAQRIVNPAWQTFEEIPSVALVARDTSATVISFTAPIEVARGTAVTDASGTRRATLLFAQGTIATMKLPDSSTQVLSQMTVRQTEFTAGALGPTRMPASLPAASAYTYALEWTADQAVAAKAVRIEFSLPVISYTENFLGMPVGARAPLGIYDYGTARWNPKPDGRVVKVLAINGGVADLDILGSGSAANQAQYDSLGVSVAERASVGTLYSVGQTLLRVPTTHFSPGDINWTFILPAWARAAYVHFFRGDHDCQTKTSGSIIGCQKQTLGEVLPVAGTPFSLYYSSERTLGFRAARQVRVPAQIPEDSASFASGLLRKNRYPPPALAVTYNLKVGGRVVDTRQFSQGGPITAATLEWNNSDVYGRNVNGIWPGTLEIGLAYNRQYNIAFAGGSGGGGGGGGSFGAIGTFASVVAAEGRDDFMVLQSIPVSLGVWDNRALALGGWSIDAHHIYDALGGKLLLGNGEQRTVAAKGQEIRTVPSTQGSFTPAGGGPPIFDRAFPGAPAMDAQGRLYIPYGGEGVLRRLDPDDSLRVVAGGMGGDDMAFGPDGSMYFVIGFLNRVWRSVNGVITVFAGTGVPGFSGDGGPATAAQLSEPQAVAVGPDGSVYIAEWANHRIRRVDPNGIISTFAGNGNFTVDWVDNVHPTQSSVPNPSAVAVAADGTVYFGSYVHLRRVTPGGTMVTVAGLGGGNGTPAQRAVLHNGVSDLSFAPNGDILISTEPRVWRMTVSGDITPIAGPTIPLCVSLPQGSVCGPAVGEGGLPLQAPFDFVAGVAMASDETFYVVDRDRHHVRRVRPMLPGLSTTDMLVPDASGREVYRFDFTGRHKLTLDGLSGDTLLAFSYDGAGRLTSLTDGTGNITTIQRDGTGTPTAIVGPFGQQTGLTLDGAGYLRQVTDPGGIITKLYHRGSGPESGLLDSLVDPVGQKHAFLYDGAGRLLQDNHPAGSQQALVRTERDTGYTVVRTTAMGRATKYQVDLLDSNDEQWDIEDPAGFITRTLKRRDGTQVTTTPDGTVISAIEGGDPRFGPASPYVSSLVVRLPSGDSTIVTSMRRATVPSPVNPFGITSFVDSMFVAGQLYRTNGSRTGSLWTEVSTSPTGRTSTVRLDSLSRIMMAAASGLDSVTYRYDASGRLDQIKDGGRIEGYGYDAQGRLKTTTDPLGRTDSLFYDLSNRLTRTRAWDGRQLQFGYDSLDNLTSLTPAGQPTHGFTYRPDGLMTSYNPPSLGAGNWSTGYSYNPDGQLNAIVRATGDSILMSYATSGRPTGVSFSRGTLGSGSISFGYHALKGTLDTILNPSGSSLRFTYDGAMPTAVTWSGAVAGSVAMGYGAALRVDTIAVNGSPVAFGYDSDGLLTTAGSLTLKRRTDNGLLQADTIGVVTGSWTFDGRAALSNYTASASGSAVYQASYVRDSLGRVSTLTETLQGGTLVRAFVYDSAGRVFEIREGSTLVRSYGYDANGNRISLTGPGLAVSGTYDAQDRIISYGNTTYSHDRNGFLTEKIEGSDTTRYVHDALGNLLQVRLPNSTIIEYIIDGQDRRVGRKVNGVLQQGWLWQTELAPAAELDASGAVVSRFVYATRVNVPDYMIKGGVTYRLVLDELGSVRLVVNSADGTIVQRLDYDEFGRVTQNTNAGFQPFGFAGGLYDGQTTLVRFGARDYDAVAGRWTSKDPLGFSGEEANLYSYLGNDPVGYYDPEGTGKVGLFAKTVKKLFKPISRRHADKILDKGGDIYVKGPGNSKKASALGREQFGRKKVRHDAHSEGQYPHYQHKNGGRGKIYYPRSLAMVGVCVFGDNFLGNLIDFFNPVADMVDAYDLLHEIGDYLFGRSPGD
jgi:RHS repeat-associated protein